MNKDIAPRHLQLREMLLRRWKGAGLKPGDRIESQNEIIKFCNFSLITVLKTLKDLEAEGVIRRQVGKGSFIVKPPWVESFNRVGLFYNRDVVGGGIFENPFYRPLIMAFENRLVSDGHAFILGSFTHDKMPLEVFEALDVVVLTSITEETDLSKLEEVTCQVCLLDQTLDRPRIHSYRIDYEPAFHDMVAHHATQCGKRALRFVYVDSLLASSEQRARLAAAKAAVAEAPPGSELRIVQINPESPCEKRLEELREVLGEPAPDVVFGYGTDALLAGPDEADFSIYPMLLDGDGPGFVTDSAEWMARTAAQIYANFEDRRAPGRVYDFAARFQP